MLKFYFRRTLRIFPPYYALILLLLVLRWIQIIALRNQDIVHALTYTSNYFAPEGWYLGHTWSLAVEEQFYLLLLCPRVRVLSIFNLFHRPDSAAFEMVADSLACGCLLAILREQLHGHRWYRSLLHSRLFFLLPLLILATSALHHSTKIYYSVGLSCINIGTAICVDWCITWHEARVGRWLNARWLVFAGVLSYSLYLWQQMFLHRTATTIITSFPLNFVLTLLAALASYYLIETPALRWRQRLERK